MTRAPIRVVDVGAALASLRGAYTPAVVAELNGQHVRVARFEGEYVWHRHREEDEMFLVLRGRIRIQLRDAELRLGRGELVVIPRGVEHKPIADEVAEVLLFEPATTRPTGDAEGRHSLGPDDLDRI